MAKLVQHKLMIGEVTSVFEAVFSSGNNHGNNKNKHRNQVELEFETSVDASEIQARFEKLKGGKTERRYKLIIDYPTPRIGEFKFSISKYCIEKKQLIILIEDFKLEKNVSLFIGKATESKIYMIRLKDELIGMPIAKVAEKLFVARYIDKSVINEGCVMHNPCVFFVDEPSLTIRSTCDTAIGMFDPHGNHSDIEPLLHQINIRYREYHQVWLKGFSFSGPFTSMLIYPNNLNNRDTYGEPSFGYCFKNGMYKIKKNEGYEKYDLYEFEECVELSMGHMERNSGFQKGVFLDFVYVRGKVKKGSKSIYTLTSWKRLCILSQNPYWISKYTLSK